MKKIYDVESDQLKCNFCTNYFKCSIHFANIQRYSLKACHKCLTNFTYTITHPTTYQIYRVLLLDVGITIPLDTYRPQCTITDSENLMLQILKTSEEINNKISLFFEQKIKMMIKDMNRTSQQLKQSFDSLEKEYNDIFDNSVLNMSGISELRAKIEKIKAYQIIDIIQEKGMIPCKDSRKLKDLSIKKPPSGYSGKENNGSHNGYNAKLIRSRIFGNQEPSQKKNLTSCSKSKVNSKSRISSSIVKSIKLDQSIDLHQSNYFEQKDRSEVSRLLDQKAPFQSYMSREVVKPSNVCLKSEGSRNVVESILEMKNKTARNGELIELIGVNAAKTNFGCYLKTLKDFREIKTVRMIRCSLVDADMDNLLNFLSENPSVETLIITNNRLTELSVEALLVFKERHAASHLKNVYIGNNYINNVKSATLLRKQHNNQLWIYL